MTYAIYIRKSREDRDKPGQCQDRRVAQHVVDPAVITNVLNTLAKIDTEIASHKTKKQRLLPAITEGIIDFVDAKQQCLPIDDALTAAQKRRTELLHQTDDTPSWDDLSLTLEDWEALTIKEQRQILPLVIRYRFPRKADGSRKAEIRLPPPGKTSPKGHWKLEQK